MKVSEQIDALEANAVDAFKYLAVTRILALMIAMPLLTILMDFSGIFGGYVAEAAVSGMSWRLYFERAFSYITYSDIIPATLKTIVFGFLIAVVSSYLGFTTSRGTKGVGEAVDAQRRDVVDAHHSERRSPREDHLLLLSGGVGMNAVRFDHVSKAFGALKVLDDISFEIPAGRAFCLLGRSGTGKSVTLRHIVGLVRPTAGRCSSRNRTSRRWPAASSPACGSTWAFCFRMPPLFDSMSVGDNVAFPMRRHTNMSGDEVRERATKKLADVGLGDDFDTMPGDLSGGMKKRAGLARAWRSTRPSCS
jgi:ABC-type ATPase involved in cell division